MQTTIRILTAAALTSLLLGTGLRLDFAQVLASLPRRGRLLPIMVANFVAVPTLALGIVALCRLPREVAVAMLLLAASPFAPVVPVFTRMARGNLALAAGLTGLFPLISALITPLICLLGLRALPGAGRLDFRFGQVLLMLFLTITLPLLGGLAFHRLWPRVASRILRPVEMIGEGIGALSLAFVTIVEFGTLVDTGWRALAAMVGLCEISLLLGYALGGPDRASRRVIALGTSNRNIALALLLAVGNFAGTPVVGAVVANGLVLILVGLLHVAWWRWRPA